MPIFLCQIELCLKAVFAQSIQPLEVIVVDGHSTDETVEIVSQFLATVLYEAPHAALWHQHEDENLFSG